MPLTPPEKYQIRGRWKGSDLGSLVSGLQGAEIQASTDALTAKEPALPIKPSLANGSSSF